MNNNNDNANANINANQQASNNNASNIVNNNTNTNNDVPNNVANTGDVANADKSVVNNTGDSTNKKVVEGVSGLATNAGYNVVDESKKNDKKKYIMYSVVLFVVLSLVGVFIAKMRSVKVIETTVEKVVQNPEAGMMGEGATGTLNSGV